MKEMADESLFGLVGTRRPRVCAAGPRRCAVVGLGGDLSGSFARSSLVEKREIKDEIRDRAGAHNRDGCVVVGGGVRTRPKEVGSKNSSGLFPHHNTHTL